MHATLAVLVLPTCTLWHTRAALADPPQVYPVLRALGLLAAPLLAALNAACIAAEALAAGLARLRARHEQRQLQRVRGTVAVHATLRQQRRALRLQHQRGVGEGQGGAAPQTHATFAVAATAAAAGSRAAPGTGAAVAPHTAPAPAAALAVGAAAGAAGAAEPQLTTTTTTTSAHAAVEGAPVPPVTGAGAVYQLWAAEASTGATGASTGGLWPAALCAAGQAAPATRAGATATADPLAEEWGQQESGGEEDGGWGGGRQHERSRRRGTEGWGGSDGAWAGGAVTLQPQPCIGEAVLQQQLACMERAMWNTTAHTRVQVRALLLLPCEHLRCKRTHRSLAGMPTAVLLGPRCCPQDLTAWASAGAPLAQGLGSDCSPAALPLRRALLSCALCIGVAAVVGCGGVRTTSATAAVGEGAAAAVPHARGVRWSRHGRQTDSVAGGRQEGKMAVRRW